MMLKISIIQLYLSLVSFIWRGYAFVRYFHRKFIEAVKLTDFTNFLIKRTLSDLRLFVILSSDFFFKITLLFFFLKQRLLKKVTTAVKKMIQRLYNILVLSLIVNTFICCTLINLFSFFKHRQGQGHMGIWGHGRSSPDTVKKNYQTRNKKNV